MPHQIMLPMSFNPSKCDFSQIWYLYMLQNSHLTPLSHSLNKYVQILMAGELLSTAAITGNKTDQVSPFTELTSGVRESDNEFKIQYNI